MYGKRHSLKLRRFPVSFSIPAARLEVVLLVVVTVLVVVVLLIVLVIFVVLVVVSVCAVVEFVVVVVIVLRHFKFLLVVNSYTSSMSFYYIKYTKTFLGLWYYFLLQFFKSLIIIRM